jgi:hypothetical protein
MLSWIPEALLRLFFYRDLADLAPPKGTRGLFTETPMVNNNVLEQIRSGKAEWLRGDVVRFNKQGVIFNHRTKGVPKGGPGREEHIKGDVCILATGFERPSLAFLPPDCFQKDYSPPNWYLQVFPPGHPDICANNCTYVNAIGTVGNYHIGIYTRFLLMFLVDPLTRPSEGLMKLWIDFTRWVKKRAPTAAFDFFTYSELVWWFLFVIAINPFRWKWAFFVLYGIGSSLPMSIVQAENRLRQRVASRNGEEQGSEQHDTTQQAPAARNAQPKATEKKDAPKANTENTNPTPKTPHARATGGKPDQKKEK